MPSPRRTALVLLTATVALVGVGLVPAAALAQSGNEDITIVSVAPDGSGNPYDITVVADDGDGSGAVVSTMTVHFLQGSTDVLDVPMSASDTSDPTNETWVPASVPTAAELPVGSYTISVDADDGTGQPDTGLVPENGSPYLVAYGQTDVTVTPSQSTVTNGSQSVTFTGTVMGVAQDGSNTQIPISGATVDVSDGGTTPTLSDGSFSYTANNISAASTDFTFSVAAADDGSYPAGSASTTITAEAATTTVSVLPSETTVSQGSEQIIFAGSVTAGGSPVAGAPVDVTIGGVPAGTAGSTGSDGSFTYEATGVSAATDYNFSVAGTNLYTAGNDDIPIGTSQSATSITMNPPSQAFVTWGATSLTISGSVNVTPSGGTATGIGPGIPVVLTDSQGTQDTTTSDANGDFAFNVSDITQGDTYSVSVGSTNLYTSASASVAVPADPASTAIVGAQASTDPVTLGSPAVNITGSVQVTPPNSSTATGIGAGIPVDVSVNGGPATQVTTSDSNGDFSFPAGILTAATTFTISVPGTNLYSPPAQDEVSVTATLAETTMSVTPGAPTVTFGSDSVDFNGTVTGPSSVGVPEGTPVYLSIGGGTPSQVTTTSDASGDFSYTASGVTSSAQYQFSVDSAGTYQSASYPVQVTADPGQTAIDDLTTSQLGPQTVTYSGTVDVTPAGSTTPQPIGSGVQVKVEVNNTAYNTVTTDSNGDFSDPISGTTAGTTYSFSVGGTSLYSAITATNQVNKQDTTIVVTPSQSTVTEGSQDVTFTCTVEVTPTGSTTPVSIGSGVPVFLALNGGTSTTQVGTTNASGQITYLATGIGQKTSYTFSIQGTSTYNPQNQPDTIVPVAAETRIASVKVSPSRLKYGQKATLTGTVQYQSGSTWTSLPGTTVDLAEGKKSLGSVSSASNGSFKATLPSTNGFGWSAMVNAATLTQQTSAIGNLAISVPMRVRSFAAALGVTGTVTISGCLQVTAPVSYGPATTVQVQYSANGRTRWKLLGRLQLHNFARTVRSCAGQDESYFSGSINAKIDNGYYRADYPATLSFQGAVSKVIHSWRYQTKITGFKVSPRSVTRGQIVSISGQLWHRPGKSWEPYGGKTVEFIYNQRGTNFWGKLGSGRTSKKGYFSQNAAGGSGNFIAVIYAVYVGSSTDLEAKSPGIGVTVKLTNASGRVMPSGAAQFVFFVAPTGSKQKFLAREEYLIAGVLPATLPTL